jgi:hypothetical protein
MAQLETVSMAAVYRLFLQDGIRPHGDIPAPIRKAIDPVDHGRWYLARQDLELRDVSGTSRWNAIE